MSKNGHFLSRQAPKCRPHRAPAQPYTRDFVRHALCAHAERTCRSTEGETIMLRSTLALAAAVLIMAVPAHAQSGPPNTAREAAERARAERPDLQETPAEARTPCALPPTVGGSAPNPGLPAEARARLQRRPAHGGARPAGAGGAAGIERAPRSGQEARGRGTTESATGLERARAARPVCPPLHP